MTFIRQTTEVDFGSTSIENIFINDFMPAAPGTYVKVYLMGYKYACDKDLDLRVSNKMLSRHLNIPMEDVLGAWTFWENKGIIRKIPTRKSDKTDFNVEFLSLRQLFIDNNYSSNIAPKGNIVSLQRKPSQPAVGKDRETSKMFEAIESIVGRPISVNEAVQITEFMEAYSMKPVMVLEAYTIAGEKRGIHASKYIGGILKNWYDKGIFTPDELTARREEESMLQSKYKQIFASLGFSSRNPSKAEKTAMDKWLNEWGFPIDMVLKACDNTIYASKPSIKYIHSILSAWNKAGVKTPEALEKYNSGKKSRLAKPAAKNTNKFHNFKQAPPDYSEEELEKILKEINNLK